MHVNIRSLMRNVNRLEELISLMLYQPDIIAITETKLKSSSYINLIQLPGYHFIHTNSLSQAGGVALYQGCSTLSRGLILSRERISVSREGIFKNKVVRLKWHFSPSIALKNFCV